MGKNDDKCNENEMKIRVIDMIIEHSYVQWSMLEYENKRGPVLRLKKKSLIRLCAYIQCSFPRYRKKTILDIDGSIYLYHKCFQYLIVTNNCPNWLFGSRVRSGIIIRTPNYFP